MIGEASEPSAAGAASGVNGPTPGERARTLAYGVAGGALAVPGVPYTPVPAHVTDERGRPLLLMPSGAGAVTALDGEPDVPATLRIADVAPVPLADRVRGRASLHGWITEVPPGERRAAAVRLSRLHPRPELLDLGTTGTVGTAGAAGPERPAWTVLALEIAQVEIEDGWGSATLEPEEYEASAPDPFVVIEAGMIAHLDSCHRDELGAMLRRLDGLPGRPAARGGPAPAVRPLGLDRYGMWLRCRVADGEGAGDTDLRLVFGEPVADVHGLRCAYRRLFAGGRARGGAHADGGFVGNFTDVPNGSGER
ncbi:DUF2470 domain-containing protein [Actinomadura viridis]|uniref:DUF2470 domain-containing protein n=1 Tax=Actinomadura viridis TaxID=58110 RepID=A0A931DTQ6_9ACTN|nr:DUF2470 domain-containing protein [Actinomadura viridis]MBG6093736.1 hypothetical protein [Actinomadura viridis]